PVLHAQHLPMLQEVVPIQPEPRGQFSGGADSLMTSAPQGIDWSQTSVWLGVPAALSVVLMTAAIRRSMALLSVGAVMMGVLFVPCGAWALFINHKGMDGANLDSWAVAAHLVGMFLALPVVVIAGWLHCRDSG
ncbi:hypothetical protein ACGFI5_28930, partial [Micromonospora tulbaghiae]|uniref:hypothetical protein n=1 Tax=Micromonospora tulbaghiae TaxID=479978 RepID=UPI00371958E0